MDGRLKQGRFWSDTGAEDAKPEAGEGKQQFLNQKTEQENEKDQA